MIPWIVWHGSMIITTTTTPDDHAKGRIQHNNNQNDVSTPKDGAVVVDRCSTAVLRRAAGSSLLATLQAALQGWTTIEVDQMAFPAPLSSSSSSSSNLSSSSSYTTQDGKNAVHMAAWQGSLDNLKYLLEEMHCDPNQIALGTYSYGKTPIFFAMTRCRAEVVEYLLHRPENDVQVNIINNKGQSVLSLAASHLLPDRPDLVDRIQQLEQEQVEQCLSSSKRRLLSSTTPGHTTLQHHNHPYQHEYDETGWWNFRRTHSDGLEYGDLDPRFLDRPLRATDVVTPWAINPTTKASRRGSFQRRNPSHECQPGPLSASTTTTPEPKKDGNRTKHKRRPEGSAIPLSTDDQVRFDQAWELLLVTLQNWTSQGERPVSHASEEEDPLETILRISDQCRQPWIRAAAQRLLDTQTPLSVVEDFLRHSDLQNSHNTIDRERDSRKRELVNKLIAQLHRLSSSSPSPRSPGSEQREPFETTPSPRRSRAQLGSAEKWAQVEQWVRDHGESLTMSRLQHSTQYPMLSLPQPPLWVDDVAGLERLSRAAREATVVTLDTEWCQVPGQASSSRSFSSDSHDDEEEEDGMDKEGSIGPSDGAAADAAHVSTVSERTSRARLTVSTLQVAWGPPDFCQAWVIDLLCPRPSHNQAINGDEDAYVPALKVWIRDLFNHKMVVGFAMHHDLAVLEAWLQDEVVGDDPGGRYWKIPRENCLDLQARYGPAHAAQPPGLAAMVASSSSGWCLSKELQCSDWSQRPLTEAQLEYAGLDAVILWVLLSLQASR